MTGTRYLASANLACNSTGRRDRHIRKVALKAAALLQDQRPVVGRHVDHPAQAHSIHGPSMVQSGDDVSPSRYR